MYISYINLTNGIAKILIAWIPREPKRRPRKILTNILVSLPYSIEERNGRVPGMRVISYFPLLCELNSINSR